MYSQFIVELKMKYSVRFVGLDLQVSVSEVESFDIIVMSAMASKFKIEWLLKAKDFILPGGMTLSKFN